VEERPILVLRRREPRKLRGAAPHDMGSPLGSPFELLNAFNFLVCLVSQQTVDVVGLAWYKWFSL